MGTHQANLIDFQVIPHTNPNNQSSVTGQCEQKQLKFNICVPEAKLWTLSLHGVCVHQASNVSMGILLEVNA